MNCYHCGSERTRKHGKTRNGKQRYQCRACGRSFREQPEAPGYTDAAKAQILRAYQERTSLRGLTRIFGVSRNTVSKWLKKSPESAAFGGHAGSGPVARRVGTG
ncbi:MAG: IS1 family transposase [Candidatus Competibacteraceae bacterium]|nr:IS1 family transposase [Candidatus Competibacteraceae bacterium]